MAYNPTSRKGKRVRARRIKQLNTKLENLTTLLQDLLKDQPWVQVGRRKFKLNPMDEGDYRRVVEDIYRWKGELQDLGEIPKIDKVGKGTKNIAGVIMKTGEDGTAWIPNVTGGFKKKRVGNIRQPQITLGDPSKGEASALNRKTQATLQTFKDSPDWKTKRKAIVRGLDSLTDLGMKFEGHHMLMLQLYAPWFEGVSNDDSIELIKTLMEEGHWTGDHNKNFAFLNNLAHKGEGNSVHTILRKWGIYADKNTQFNKAFLDKIKTGGLEWRKEAIKLYANTVQDAMPEIFALAIAENELPAGTKIQNAFPDEMREKIANVVKKVQEGTSDFNVKVDSARLGRVASVRDVIKATPTEQWEQAGVFGFKNAAEVSEAAPHLGVPSLAFADGGVNYGAGVAALDPVDYVGAQILEGARLVGQDISKAATQVGSDFAAVGGDIANLAKTTNPENYARLADFAKPGTSFLRRGAALMPFVGAAADAWDVSERYKVMMNDPNEGLADWLDKAQFALATGTAATTWWAEPANFIGGVTNLGIDIARTAFEEEKRADFMDTMEHIGVLGGKAMQHLF